MKFRRQKKTSAFNPHNKVRLVRGGKDYFDTLEKLISNAKNTIHFQTYIFDNDETGLHIKNLLVDASLRGVKVALMVDGYASDLPDDFIAELKTTGILFRRFEPWFSSNKFYFGRRLHHKIVVADEIFSLVGGINISNRYNDIQNIPAWLDFAIFTEGQASVILNSVCEELWGKKYPVKKLPYEEKKIIFKERNNEEMAPVRARRNDWVRGRNDISRSYNEMLNKASANITIMCSYFFPSRFFRYRMRAASKRGVKIKVILAGISDVKLSKFAERYLYSWMLQNKIEIYEYQKTVLHAKIASCDDEWATLGSYNINNLSAHASIELNLDIKDTGFVKTVNQTFSDIIKNDCTQITFENYERRKNVFSRVAEWGAYTIVRFVLFIFIDNLKTRKRN
ncbi:MAG: phosphatidylserine/phosphatidylglycerophosphate/cardiolipin synthase family protein [Bacteroidia bacterium]